MVSDGKKMVRVGVCGAAGRMGKEVVKTILAEEGLELVMAVDTSKVGQDAALVAGYNEPCDLPIEKDLKRAMQDKKPQVVVDFTEPEAAFNNTLIVLQEGGRSVIGTTGLSPQNIGYIETEVINRGLATLLAPNFAIGAVLLMKFAQEASKYFEHAEIIELHHNRKLDAPSGTAFRTADLMSQVRSKFGGASINNNEKELLLGSRGGTTEAGIHIHSVRLPGLVAHEEVIFGGIGQTMTIRHDSFDRTSFMPGVVLAVRKIVDVQGFIYGLENLLT